MKLRFWSTVLGLQHVVHLLVVAPRFAQGNTLNRLCEVRPDARVAIAMSAGYYMALGAFGTKILVVVLASGSGVAIDNRNKQVVYMRMVEA